MPYINKSERSKFDEFIFPLIRDITNWGDVNYIVSRLLKGLHREWGLSYDFINNAMGVLSCIQAEFYRTTAAPYEQEKREENGDI